MRTASGGGRRSSLRNLRTFAYDAVSTSIENVDTGSSRAATNGLSLMRSYASPSRTGAPPPATITYPAVAGAGPR
jgi:hypothetical protein